MMPPPLPVRREEEEVPPELAEMAKGEEGTLEVANSEPRGGGPDRLKAELQYVPGVGEGVGSLGAQREPDRLPPSLYELRRTGKAELQYVPAVERNDLGSEEAVVE